MANTAEHLEIARSLYDEDLALRDYIALLRERCIPYECHYGVEARVEVVGVFQR